MNYGIPVRMVNWIEESSHNEPRIEITGKVWSRIAPMYYRRLDHVTQNLTKILLLKKALKSWILENVPALDKDNPM